jgi:toxin YoeB
MAKQIIWTDRAQKERIAIFSYWNLHNGSNLFSRKLNELIKRNLLIIRDHPEIGQLTDKEKVRVKVVKDYLIFYEATNCKIIVLSIWDCRQDTNQLKRIDPL